MPAKRAHKKSRNGCGVCRARRVKCDEVKPECGPCRKHEVRCNYDRAAFIPSRTSGKTSQSSTASRTPKTKWPNPALKLEKPPPAFGYAYTNRMADLKLMNHYTYLHLSGAQSRDIRVRHMWVYDVPQRATECEFLMQAVLSFAALHLHIHTPGDGQMREISHHYFGSALRTFTLSLSNLQMNADAALAASVLIQFQVFMSWKDPCCAHSSSYEVPVQWLDMCQGVAEVIRTASSNLRYSCMRPLIDNSPYVLITSTAPPTAAQAKMEQLSRECAAPFRKLMGYILNLESDAKPILKTTLDVVHATYQFHEAGESVASIQKRVLLFPVAVDSAFVDLLRENDPCALCILAYYFGVMQLVSSIWWFKGRPEHEIRGIHNLLPAGWKSYMDWPMQMIGGSPLVPLKQAAQEGFILGEESASPVSLGEG